MIRAENLTRTYGDSIAVQDISFSIGQGEIVGLLGHNGAGKTTIMKMLTGFLEPSSGSLTIDSIDPATEPLAVRRKIGYLPENCPVYPEMTVLEYLSYAASLHGVSDQDRPAILRRAIRETELEDRATQPIATLSRGYRQRVGVAQAILHHPKILILDEPTNGLDPTQIQHMRGLITRLARESTVIISTHILQEVQAVCSRVMIIRHGEKALDSTLAELQHSSRLTLSTDADRESLETLLKPLERISRIEPQEEKPPHLRYLLTLADTDDPLDISARIARQITEAGNNLYDLHHEQTSLETVFGEITADERRIAS